jgi:hypothetical protein
MVASTGVGFNSVTALVPLAEESAAATAFTVTLLGEGKVPGALYCPVAEIVPRAAEPPAVPFTNQLTAVFELPLTLAEKVNGSPARMLAVDGVTITLTPAGATGLPPVLEAAPLHPPSTSGRSNHAAYAQIRAPRAGRQPAFKREANQGRAMPSSNLAWRRLGFNWPHGQKKASV